MRNPHHLSEKGGQQQQHPHSQQHHPQHHQQQSATDVGGRLPKTKREMKAAAASAAHSGTSSSKSQSGFSRSATGSSAKQIDPLAGAVANSGPSEPPIQSSSHGAGRSPGLASINRGSLKQESLSKQKPSSNMDAGGGNSSNSHLMSSAHDTFAAVSVGKKKKKENAFASTHYASSTTTAGDNEPSPPLRNRKEKTSKHLEKRNTSNNKTGMGIIMDSASGSGVYAETERTAKKSSSGNIKRATYESDEDWNGNNNNEKTLYSSAPSTGEKRQQRDSGEPNPPKSNKRPRSDSSSRQDSSSSKIKKEPRPISIDDSAASSGYRSHPRISGSGNIKPTGRIRSASIGEEQQQNAMEYYSTTNKDKVGTTDLPRLSDSNVVRSVSGDRITNNREGALGGILMDRGSQYRSDGGIMKPTGTIRSVSNMAGGITGGTTFGSTKGSSTSGAGAIPTTTTSFLDALNEEERRVRTRHLPSVQGFSALLKSEIKCDLSAARPALFERTSGGAMGKHTKGKGSTVATAPLVGKESGSSKAEIADNDGSDKVNQTSSPVPEGDVPMEEEEEESPRASEEDDAAVSESVVAKKSVSDASRTSDSSSMSAAGALAPSCAFIPPDDIDPCHAGGPVVGDFFPSEIPAPEYSNNSNNRPRVAASPLVVESLTAFNPPRPPESIGAKKKHRLLRWEHNPQEVEVDLSNYRKTVQRTRVELHNAERRREHIEVVGAHLRLHFMRHLKSLQDESLLLANDLKSLQGECVKASERLPSKTNTRNRGSLGKSGNVIQNFLGVLRGMSKSERGILSSSSSMPSRPSFPKGISSFWDVSGIGGRSAVPIVSSASIPNNIDDDAKLARGWLLPGDKVSSPYGNGVILHVFGLSVLDVHENLPECLDRNKHGSTGSTASTANQQQRPGFSSLETTASAVRSSSGISQHGFGNTGTASFSTSRTNDASGSGNNNDTQFSEQQHNSSNSESHQHASSQKPDASLNPRQRFMKRQGRYSRVDDHESKPNSEAVCVLPPRICVALPYGTAFFTPGAVKSLEDPSSYSKEMLIARWKKMFETAKIVGSAVDVLGMAGFDSEKEKERVSSGEHQDRKGTFSSPNDDNSSDGRSRSVLDRTISGLSSSEYSGDFGIGGQGKNPLRAMNSNNRLEGGLVDDDNKNGLSSSSVTNKHENTSRSITSRVRSSLQNPREANDNTPITICKKRACAATRIVPTGSGMLPIPGYGAFPMDNLSFDTWEKLLSPVLFNGGGVLGMRTHESVADGATKWERQRHEWYRLKGRVLQLKNELYRQRRVRCLNERSSLAGRERSERSESLLSEMRADLKCLKERLHDELIELGIDQEKAEDMLVSHDKQLQMLELNDEDVANRHKKRKKADSPASKTPRRRADETATMMASSSSNRLGEGDPQDNASSTHNKNGEDAIGNASGSYNYNPRIGNNNAHRNHSGAHSTRPSVNNEEGGGGHRGRSSSHKRNRGMDVDHHRRHSAAEMAGATSSSSLGHAVATTEAGAPVYGSAEGGGKIKRGGFRR